MIIAIMVLKLKVPHDTNADALLPLAPVVPSCVPSFAYVGAYWNKHHHMPCAVQRVNGRVLWANLHLLFCFASFPS